MRHEVGSAGDLLWGLLVAGTAAAVVGWFMVGGIAVSMAEGGAALTSVPHPVVYLISEISNLVAVCASAFLIGLAARPGGPVGVAAAAAGVLDRVRNPRPAVLLFWLWTIVLAGWAIASGSPAATPVSREVQPV